MTTFGKNLQALIEQRGITQSAIAAVTGATDGAVSHWLAGRATPREKYLKSICEYYHVTMDELVSEANGLYSKVHRLAVGVSPVPSMSVPVNVLGSVHAGEPDEPWEISGTVELMEGLHSRHPDCFALEVNGDCMDKVFTDSDIVFVDPVMEPHDGSIAVVVNDGEAVVRRVRMGNGSMLLVSDSHGHYDDIYIGKGSEVECLGCVFWWQARKELS